MELSISINLLFLIMITMMLRTIKWLKKGFVKDAVCTWHKHININKGSSMWDIPMHAFYFTKRNIYLTLMLIIIIRGKTGKM